MLVPIRRLAGKGRKRVEIDDLLVSWKDMIVDM